MNRFAVTTLVFGMAATLAAATVEAQERNRGEGRGQRAAATQSDVTTAGQRDRRGSRRSDTTAQSRSTSPTTSAPSTSAPTQWRRGNDRTFGIDRRQSHQNAWISWGRRTGSLTGEEARALRAQQQHTAEMERRAKADGHVTRDERIGIRQAQREAGRDIRREMRDRDRRGRGWYRGGYRRWW